MTNEKKKEMPFSLNRFGTYFTISTDQSWSVYQCTPFQRKFERKVEGGFSNVSMLSNSNIFALVGNDQSSEYSKKNLFIYDDSEQTNLLQLKFNEPIVSAYISHNEIFVIFKNGIQVYSLSTLELVLQTKYYENPNGLFDFAEDTESHQFKCFVTLGPTKGTVAIRRGPLTGGNNKNNFQNNNNFEQQDGKYSTGEKEKGKGKEKENEKEKEKETEKETEKNKDFKKKKKKKKNRIKRKKQRSEQTDFVQNKDSSLGDNSLILKVFDDPIQQLTLSSCGRIIAVCSNKGTNIKIYSTENGQLITKKKRGTKRGTICSLAFNIDSNFLAAASLRGTIHIFTLYDVKNALYTNSIHSENLEKPLLVSKNKRANCKGTVDKDLYSKVAFNFSHEIIVLQNNGQFYKFEINLQSSELSLITKLGFGNSIH
ncbi:wd repeat domain phosphoinositide-interacting protein [Anaeramoeba flamelloides]|uniref:Wd repeat domain phosphoinositide-interacting protein n=1 Tax=Anaeramoeba flamelloides TaxID=1746091 RepID=A0ABQ8X7U1_9EUKA|nr:wd repeat domain phosphoinositide-interacting protein [Anaeramoeba flamelloides]